MDNYLLSANYYFLTSMLDRVILSKLILVILYCFIYSLDYITSIVTNKLILKYNKKNSINSIFIVKTNWFLLHALCNFIMCSASIPDIVTTFKNPSRSLDYTINYSMIPIFMSLSLHLYHIMNKKYKPSLSTEDYVHHILFAVGLGLLSLSVRWGPIQNLSVSVLTGLPGGLDYIMLVLIKLNIITKNTRKKYAILINNWLRAPGCVVISAWIYCSYITCITAISISAVFINILLTYINGMYYNKQIMESYFTQLVH